MDLRPEDTELLAAVHAALSAHDGAAALAALTRHEARFPTSAVASERAGLRVLALCELGRTAEARVEARAFLAHAPRDPIVQRVRASCAASE
jgi:hypothetical protein